MCEPHQCIRLRKAKKKDLTRVLLVVFAKEVFLKVLSKSWTMTITQGNLGKLLFFKKKLIVSKKKLKLLGGRCVPVAT